MKIYNTIYMSLHHHKYSDGNAVFIIVILIIIFITVVYLQANFYIKNRGGFAPLHLCCQNGHNETCRVLLLNGCKPDIKNNVSEFIQKQMID